MIADSNTIEDMFMSLLDNVEDLSEQQSLAFLADLCLALCNAVGDVDIVMDLATAARERVIKESELHQRLEMSIANKGQP